MEAPSRPIVQTVRKEPYTAVRCGCRRTHLMVQFLVDITIQYTTKPSGCIPEFFPEPGPWKNRHLSP